MSERMKGVDEGKTDKSIWDLLGHVQKRIVGVKEGELERGWIPRDDHALMKKDVKYFILVPVSLDEPTLKKTRLLGGGGMVLHPLTS